MIYESLTMKDKWTTMRGKLSGLIWPNGLPSTLPNVIIDSRTGYAELGDIYCKRVDTLTCLLPFNVYSIIHLLTPRIPINRCVIIHGGHNENYFSGNDPTLEGNLQPLIRTLLRAGYHILGCTMPLFYQNSDIFIYGIPINLHDGLHNGFSRIELYSNISALVWFLEPVIQAINYVKNNYNFKSIDMTGLSGGAWTTDMVSALDIRIRKSYPVFGSLPLNLKQILFNTGLIYDNADWEQSHMRSWWDILSTEENLYVLGCKDFGRRRMQVLGNHDTAFPIASINPQVLAYEAVINALVPVGQHQVFIDTTATIHQYTAFTISAIIADLSS